MARATFDPGEKLRRIRKKLLDPSVALKQIGVLMVAESQRAFRNQQFGNEQWPARAPFNLFGALADFAQGKSRLPNRRFESRPALRDSGRLAASIAHRLIAVDTVEVGSNLPYAAVQHRGGKTQSVPLTQEVRARFWKWLRRQPRERRDRYGWVLNPKFAGKRLTQTVPARPIVGVTAETRETVRKVVNVKIFETR